MRFSSPRSEFAHPPSVSLNAVSERTAGSTSPFGGRCSSGAVSLAGFSHGDLTRTGAARTIECPARSKAVTRLRTCTEAPFRPRTGMPRSGQRYRIFIPVWRQVAGALCLKVFSLRGTLASVHVKSPLLHEQHTAFRLSPQRKAAPLAIETRTQGRPN